MEMEMLPKSLKGEAKDPTQDTSPEGDAEKEPSAERKLRYAKQILIVLGASISYQNDGMGLSWPNTFASDIQDDQSTIFNNTLHVSDWQIDMMSSMQYAGSIPTAVIGGWLVSVLGRQKCMMLVAAPGIVGWLFVALAPNVPMILIGRFLTGVAFGLHGIAIRTYVAEVPDTNIRGAAGTMVELMKGTGAITIICLSIILPWYYLAIFCVCHFLIYGLLVVPLLPESPTYLVVKEREEEATKVLRSLKGPQADLKGIIKELKKTNERADGVVGWGVLLKPDILKKCGIIFGLFIIATFCGSEVIRGNATRMLQSSGLALDKDVTTIIVFVVLLGGNLSQTIVLDRLGRRKCLVLSLILVCFAYAVLGTYVFLNTPEVELVPFGDEGNATMFFDTDIRSSDTLNSWSWVPSACLMVAAFATSLGIGPIPWLLSAEYFPTNIRPKVLSVCTNVANVAAIVTLQLYSPLQNLLTPAGLFWSYAAFAGLGIIYTIVFVYETKGVNVG